MKAVPIAVFGVLGILGGLTLYRAGFLKQGGDAAPKGPTRLSGVISANEVIASAKIAGRILKLRVDEGDWIKADQLIAELDRAEMEAEKQTQLARIQQLAAKLNQNREVVILERDRSREQLARAEAQLQVAESQHAQAMSELSQLRKDASRAQELMNQGILARQEVERQLTLVQVGESRVKSLDEQVRSARAELELCRANLRQVSVASMTVDQSHAESEQAQAQLNQISSRLEYTKIRAPQQGMVSLRIASQGEVIKPGDPIVTIVDLDDVWVRAAAEESVVGRIAVGQSLPVQLVSGEVIQGTVRLISPEAEFATQRDVSRAKRDIRTFGIKVQIPNPQRRIHPGMTAYVLLPEEPAAPTPDQRSDLGSRKPGVSR